MALRPGAARPGDGGRRRVVVCPSGNLANIYFTREPGRLSLEYLVATYPGLVEGLASHPGVGFVMVYSEARGHVVLGQGAHATWTARPWGGGGPPGALQPQPGGPAAARISGYDNVGDLLVNTFYDRPRGRWPPSRS